MTTLLSNTWSNIFKPNEGPIFQNNNTKRVSNSFQEIKPQLSFNKIVNFNLLIPNHPLTRPIELEEISNSIKTTKDKAPGLTGIMIKQIKYLPANCLKIINNIYNSILSSRYFPTICKKEKLIFIHKTNKDATNPVNYRPICLIELLRIFLKE